MAERSAGKGRRMTDHGEDPQTGDIQELLDVEAASALVGVPVEQVLAMADQGLLIAEASTSGPRFSRAQLLAARHQGG